jgi:hypothetical protein
MIFLRGAEHALFVRIFSPTSISQGKNYQLKYPDLRYSASSGRSIDLWAARFVLTQ